ncbi:major facilitator superfamily domain-containing protein [Kockovaella imperatae]|uniref:Major facilitator superfamily domain-containing protein n=1 Tax=Kockovaella imperatae TaxID=4999 RepID=A0A1Y1UEJ5_9TREE|nr:major facilitator superfamily domain-containing protein [Kockovaella imperatae]ORX36481.1 major facilitator superfamily domain-containing protein [Kockovaella imperatae]
MAESLADGAGLELEAHDRRTGLQKVSRAEISEEHLDFDEEETLKGDTFEPLAQLDDRPAAKTQLSPLNTSITRPTQSGSPYSIFSTREKWVIVGLSSLAGIFSPIGSNIYVPAIPSLADAFHVSNEKINLTVTLYLVFQAVTPAIWGAASDSYGRRPVYLIILLIFIGGCMGTALCPTDSYWLLMLMRAVQSTGGSAVIAIGTGVIADVAVPQERGKFLGVFSLGTNFGPSIGPFLGGMLAYTLGWRSIFWFLLITSAVTYVLVALFLRETLRSLVGNGSIAPPPWNRTLLDIYNTPKVKTDTEEVEVTLPEKPKRAPFKPWASFMLAFEPDLFMMFFYASIFYSLWYAVLTIFSTLLRDNYHVSEIVIGLCYFPHGLCAGLVSFGTGRIMDVVYRREKRRVGGDHREKPEEFRLERVRFVFFPPSICLLVISTICLGWSFEAKAPIAVPIILNTLVGISLGFLTTVTVYGLDLFPGQGGAATATFNLLRCILGAVTVSVVQIINTRFGAGWTFVILSGVSLSGTPLPLVVLKYGPGWRIKRWKNAKVKSEADRISEMRRLEGVRAGQGDEEERAK